MEETETVGYRRLSHGDVFGRHKILAYLGEGIWGDMYSVTFGSTNRMYTLHILPKEFNLDELQEFLKICRNIDSPNVVKYFEAGVHECGLMWLRSEYIYGIPTEYLHSQLVSSSSSVEGNSQEITEHVPEVKSLNKLLSMTNDRISSFDRNVIIGDILEILSHLHVNGLYCGLDFSNPVLDKVRRPTGLIAKLPAIMIPMNLGYENGVEADLCCAARLIKSLAEKSDCFTNKDTKFKEELIALADYVLEGDSSDIVNCDNLNEKLLDIFEKYSVLRKDRCERSAFIRDGVEKNIDKNDEILENESESQVETQTVTHQRTSVRRKKKTHRRNQKPKMTDSVKIFFKALFWLGGLVVVGVISIILLIRWEEDSFFRNRNAESVFNSITNLDEPHVEQAENISSFIDLDVLLLDVNQLKAIYEVKLSAAIRYAILLHTGTTVEQDKELAQRIMQEKMNEIDVASSKDNEISFWKNYAILLGVGYEQSVSTATSNLERLAANGVGKASLLLGDWAFANKKGLDEETVNRDALFHWKRIVLSYAQYSQYEVLMATDRISYMLANNRVPSIIANEMLGVLEEISSRGNVVIMYCLANLYYDGKVVEKDHSKALIYYRRLAQDQRVKGELRGFAMRRMALIFEKGTGSRRSYTAAAMWFKRAAELGDKVSMLRLATYSETGIADELKRKNLEEAEKWRDKAKSAKVLDFNKSITPVFFTF